MARGTVGEETLQPSVPADAAFPRKITPREEPDSSVSQGIEALGSTLDNKFRSDAATWAGDQLAQARVNAAQTLRDMQQNAPAGDPGNFTDKYLAALDAQLEKVGGVAAQDRYTGPLWDRGATALRAAMGQAAMQWEAQTRTAYRTDSIKQNLDAQLAVVRAHPGMADQVGADLLHQVNVLPTDEPGRKVELARGIDKQLMLNAAMGVADGVPRAHGEPAGPDYVYHELMDPNGTKDPILSRVVDPRDRKELLDFARVKYGKAFADKVVDVYRNQGPIAGSVMYAKVDKLDVPDEIKDQIRKGIQQDRMALQAERQQQYGQELLQVHEAISSGEPPAGTRDRIYHLWRVDALPGTLAGSMLGELDRAERRNAEDAASFASIDQSFKNPGKFPLHPWDKDEMETLGDWFDAQTKHAGAAPGSQPWINFGLQVEANTGAVPKTMRDWIGSTIIGSKDAKAVVAAADAIDRIKQTNAAAAQYFADDKRLSSFADQVMNLKRAGNMSDEDVVAIAREREARLPDEQKKRDEEWRYAQPAGSHDLWLQNVITEQLKDDPNYTTGHWYGHTIDFRPPAGMVADYEAGLRSYWERNGHDMKGAQESEGRDIKLSWGLSMMNGRPEMLRTPPERMFPGLTTDVIRAHVAQEVKENPEWFRHWNPASGKLEQFEADPSKVILAPSPTGSTRLTNGLTWALTYERSPGVFEPIFGKNGGALEMDLPVRPADYKDTVEKERRRQIEAADARFKAREKAEREVRGFMEQDTIGAEFYHPGPQ